MQYPFSGGQEGPPVVVNSVVAAVVEGLLDDPTDVIVASEVMVGSVVPKEMDVEEIIVVGPVGLIGASQVISILGSSVSYVLVVEKGLSVDP